jgi:transcription initiation factor IIE alpha subunit
MKSQKLRKTIKWRIIKPIQWKLTDLIRYVIPRTFTCPICKTKYSVWDRSVIYPFCPSCETWSMEGKEHVKAHYQHN